MIRAATAGLALLAAASITACESTQDKSDRIAREGGGTRIATKGVEVRRQDRHVKVVSTHVIQDANGAAVVVAIRNRTRKPLVGVPIAVSVRGRRGRTLFRNNAAGLEPSLVGPSVLPPRTTFAWVNDQVQVAQRARSARARTGGGKPVRTGKLPRLELTSPRLEGDPVSGLAATGAVTNRSRVEQRKLVVYAVARREGRVVAAGRAQINRLKPGKRAHFQVFFIGNPRGAKVQLAAPPTRLA